MVAGTAQKCKTRQSVPQNAMIQSPLYGKHNQNTVLLVIVNSETQRNISTISSDQKPVAGAAKSTKVSRIIFKEEHNTTENVQNLIKK